MLRRFTIAFLALNGLGLTAAMPASAQGLGDLRAPAEYPPAGYTGRQYVDSEGCVFVRAGQGGAVTWVPRVSRQRKQICGQTPTFAAARPADTAPPRVAAGPTPASPVPTQARAPATPRRSVAATPVPAPVRIAQAPAPVRVAEAPARPVRRPATAPASGTACPNLSPVAQPYVRERPGFPVRCGPQAEDPAGRDLRGGAGSALPGSRRLVVAAPPPIAPPPGYRAAFKDDRLNPHRGVQTLEGAAQMALVWTQTLPRRLVDQKTGRDVTGLFPALRYPFTSMGAQRAAGRPVTIVTEAGNRVRVRVVPAPSRRSGGTMATMSSKSPDPATVEAAPVPVRTRSAGGGLVQVGAFGVPGNAQRAARRLQALGLPVRISAVRQRGRVLQVVQAGPFSAPAELGAALAEARRAGFSDAFVRR